MEFFVKADYCELKRRNPTKTNIASQDSHFQSAFATKKLGDFKKHLSIACTTWL